MNDRTARLIYVGGTLLCLGASSANAQAGYPPPAQPQPAYPPGTYAQPVQQPAPVYQQPAYQQPAYQPAPAPAPSPVAPAPQPQYAQPQPQYAQPQPQYAQPAPAPAYAPQPDPYAPAPGVAPEMAPAAGTMPEGAVQLGLSTTLVSYQPLSIEFENNGGKFDRSDLKWGIAENPVSIEIGYGLSDKIVFGGLVGLGGSSTTTTPDGGADQKSSEFAFELGPKLDFMFSPGAKANPFIGAEALVHLDSSDFGGGSKNSDTVFVFLARVGLRAFVADSFSIDPALVVGGGFGSGSQNGGGGAADADFSLSGFRIGLNIAASGWIQ